MSDTATPFEPVADRDERVDHGPSAAAGTRGGMLRRLRRRRKLVASVLSAIVVVLCAGWWNNSLEAYGNVNSEVSGELLAPGRSLLVGLGPRPNDGSVTLVDVIPVVTSNTARAAVEVMMCDDPRDGNPPGVVTATAAQYCGRAAKVDGYVQSAIRGGAGGPTLQDRDGHIVVQITPQQAGDVQVRGARVTYRVGIRHQTQWTGIKMRFTSP